MARAPKNKAEAILVIEGIMSKFWQTGLLIGLDRDDDGDEAMWIGGTGLGTHREGLMRRAFGKMFPAEADNDDDADIGKK